MNKTLRFYIVITVFALVTAYACGEDILDNYITGFIAKSDNAKVKLPVSVDDSQIQTSSSSEKTADSQEALKPEDTGNSQLNKSKELRQKLKDSSIKPLPGAGGPNINTQLQDVLSQLKSLSFSEMDEAVEPEPKAQLQTETVIAKVQSNANKVDGNEKPKSQSSGQSDQPRVVLPDDTSGVVDSFELAESLFHIEDKVNALKYYRKAYELSLPADTGPNSKRAWILFQIGNSLYGNDSIEAIKIYEQLILEHPSSDWTNCARTKLQVLKWLLAEKPMALTMSEAK